MSTLILLAGLVIALNALLLAAGVVIGLGGCALNAVRALRARRLRTAVAPAAPRPRIAQGARPAPEPCVAGAMAPVAG